jgi:hypothetical protein
MKANELRIGNYVKGIGHNISWLVDGVDTYYIYSSNAWRLLSSFEGIPLNEKWLEKFGFKCVDTYDDHHYYLDSKHGFSLNRSFQHLDCEYDLEYVHQLQNLYWSLTGEELTIKC